jgi:amino acid transporter
MVLAEMKDPLRDLPRVVQSAMPTVLSCYLLINVAYYIAIPWDDISTSKAIAVV